MLFQSRTSGAHTVITWSLVCGLTALGVAAYAQAPGAATKGEASAAERARANIEAATVDPAADKECVTDDPADVAKRAQAKIASGFMNLTTQMIEDAHTSCDVFWDGRDATFERSMESQIESLNTWPGPWTQPAVLEIERLMPESNDRDFIPRERCQAAAKADALFCESVQHPIVRPFCSSWLKIKRGGALDISACETFAPEQQKACSFFLGVDPKACEGAEGQEALWCSFIASLRSGGLPGCTENFTHDGCMRDVLMLTVQGGDKPCDAIRRHMKEKPKWAVDLLHGQCEAIVASKPDECPEDPKRMGGDQVVDNLSSAYLRGGADGVRPVVAVVTWSNSGPSPGTARAAQGAQTSSGAEFSICATEVTAFPREGPEVSRYAVTMGSAQSIHRATGAPFPSAVDPFTAQVKAQTVCAWTAPWLGRVAQ